MDDPYTTLGVSREATQDQIKSAYRKLARKFHPDLNPGNKQAEEKFKKISAAYDLLSDAAQRARFDAGEIDAAGAERQRRAWRTHAEGPDGARYSGGFRFGDDADDILSELLRRRTQGRQAWGFGFGGFGGSGEESGMRGQDAQYVLSISLPEAALGATKRIALPNGRSLDVKVPAGTTEGTVLRLKGQGGAGAGGGASGDALIEVKIEPHPVFSRDGDNITMTLPVTLAEAVLGAKVTVTTLDGKVALSVPPGSNSGTVLRLKGKGVRARGGHGDLLVTLSVVLPERPDPELEAFLRKWAAAHPYDVRGKLEQAS